MSVKSLIFRRIMAVVVMICVVVAVLSYRSMFIPFYPFSELTTRTTTHCQFGVYQELRNKVVVEPILSTTYSLVGMILENRTVTRYQEYKLFYGYSTYYVPYTAGTVTHQTTYTETILDIDFTYALFSFWIFLLVALSIFVALWYSSKAVDIQF